MDRQGAATFRHQDFEVWGGRAEHPGQPSVVSVVAPVDLPLDGENPTYLTRYGGFHVQGHLGYLDLI